MPPREETLKYLPLSEATYYIMLALVRPRHGYAVMQMVERLSEEAAKDLVAEARKHAATRILRSVPGIGPIRAAVILGVAATPHRFRTKKQFWGYCGLAVVTVTSAEYELFRVAAAQR